MDDRTRWNAKYTTQPGPRRVNARLIQHAPLLKPGRLLDLAGGTGQNAHYLAQSNPNFKPILADASDAALLQAPPLLNLILCDAATLPFPQHSFDTILCIRFYDPRVHFADYLTPGGTLFFETFTLADAKYRPEFNPAHRFDPTTIPTYFQHLEFLHTAETDDGHRVFITIIARKKP